MIQLPDEGYLRSVQLGEPVARYNLNRDLVKLSDKARTNSRGPKANANCWLAIEMRKELSAFTACW
jgi:hypothetical protein